MIKPAMARCVHVCVCVCARVCVVKSHLLKSAMEGSFCHIQQFHTKEQFHMSEHIQHTEAAQQKKSIKRETKMSIQGLKLGVGM